MKLLKIKASVFDPEYPERPFGIEDVGVDDWYDYAVIQKRIFDTIGTIPIETHRNFNISSGMKIKLPIVELGLKINSLKINKIKAYVVEEGDFDIILGKDVIADLFQFNFSDSDSLSFTSSNKEDTKSLSIKLHSLSDEFNVLNVENYLKGQRKLYNTLLILNNEIKVKNALEAKKVIESDFDIPEKKKLKISWIEQGSIWLTLKSFAKSLSSLGKLLGESKLSKMKKEILEAEKVKTESEVLAETRELVIARKSEEEKKLTVQNIHETHQVWRKEISERIKFYEDMISKVKNKEVAAELQKQLDDSIQLILGQAIMPEVINVPDEKLLGEGKSRMSFLPTIFKKKEE